MCIRDRVSVDRDGKGCSSLPTPIDPEDHGDEVKRHQGTTEAEHRYVGETEKQVRDGGDNRYEHSKDPDLTPGRKKKWQDDEGEIDSIGEFTSEQEIKQFDPTIRDRRIEEPYAEPVAMNEIGEELAGAENCAGNRE